VRSPDDCGAVKSGGCWSPEDCEVAKRPDDCGAVKCEDCCVAANRPDDGDVAKSPDDCGAANNCEEAKSPNDCDVTEEENNPDDCVKRDDSVVELFKAIYYLLIRLLDVPTS